MALGIFPDTAEHDIRAARTCTARSTRHPWIGFAGRTDKADRPARDRRGRPLEPGMLECTVSIVDDDDNPSEAGLRKWSH